MDATEGRLQEEPKWKGSWVLPQQLMLKEPQKRVMRLIAVVVLTSLFLIILLDGLGGVNTRHKGAFTDMALTVAPETGLETPADGAGTADSPRELERSLARDLEAILSRIKGAGEVHVEVALEGGQIQDYVQDRVNGEETVAVVQGPVKSSPLIRQVRRPEVKGVLVVAQGGTDPSVREELVRAVQSAMGVPIHMVRVSPGAP